jgi:hypothetical protein
MNKLWSNVLVGAASGILCAMTMGAIAELGPLGTRLIFPADAVIAMAGECPLGWRRYDAANGRYIIGADGRDLEAGTIGRLRGAGVEYQDRALHGPQEVVISASQPRLSLQGGLHGEYFLVSRDPPWGYIALSLCQRR